MNTDPIADLLTRVRNGQRAGNEVISVPASHIKIAIAHILKKEGFITNYRCIRDGKQGLLKVTLKYRERGASEQQQAFTDGVHGVIREIKRLSRPGCRWYVGSKEIPLVKNGFGIVVLSTSRGIMTDREARRHGTGGELLCSVY